MELESILTNAMKLYNARNKCKELRFSFASVGHNFPVCSYQRRVHKVVTDAELLGETISGDLS